MATLGGDLLTLADVAKQTDPNGMPAQIAEVLAESMPILDDIPWMPSNLPTGHRSSIRAGLPSVNLRRINEGVASGKGTYTQITDSLSLIEAHSTVDAKLLEISGNSASVRFNEGRAFIESMGQRATELIIDGSEADDEREFNGLMARSAYSSLGDNCLTAGGSTNLSSIWLVGWGAEKVFGIYPKNTAAGLKHRDHGLSQIQTDDAIPGAKLFAYVDQYSWDLGLVVKDERYIVRIPNIDSTAALQITGTQELTDFTTNILYLMARATHRIPNLAACKPCFYMARTIFEALDVQSIARTTGAITATSDAAEAGISGTDGTKRGPVTMFRGIPIKVLDELGYAETAVTA